MCRKHQKTTDAANAGFPRSNSDINILNKSLFTYFLSATLNKGDVIIHWLSAASASSPTLTQQCPAFVWRWSQLWDKVRCKNWWWYIPSGLHYMYAWTGEVSLSMFSPVLGESQISVRHNLPHTITAASIYCKLTHRQMIEHQLIHLTS